MDGSLVITVQDAARIMRTSELKVRGRIRRKEVDYGEAFPSEHINRWSKRPERTMYKIYAGRFAKFLGVTLEELREAVAKLHAE